MKISVRGVDYTPVHVSEVGIFSIIVRGVRYESDTLAGLRSKVFLRARGHGVKVTIPFTAIENGVIRNGVATGFHEVDGSILVHWEETPYRAETLGWSCTTLAPLTEHGADLYRQLSADYWAARSVVEKFEQRHAIDLRSRIIAAISVAVEKEDKEL